MAKKFNFKGLDVKDILDKVEDVVKEIKDNKELRKAFMENPVKALEDVLDMDLPDEQVKKVVNMIEKKLEKADIDVDKVGAKVEDKVDDLIDGIGGLFKK